MVDSPVPTLALTALYLLAMKVGPLMMAKYVNLNFDTLKNTVLITQIRRPQPQAVSIAIAADRLQSDHVVSQSVHRQGAVCRLAAPALRLPV